mmetsp:Transcript_10986/g.18365  ORF Transcript_10986/g.18365 Transcript_10986/m.18365 type:complete len:110 (-) Transcript_10986:3-332(-)
MDSQTTQQIPDVAIKQQDLVQVHLHTKQLKGLSYRDLELATIIDSFDLEKYMLVPLEREAGYRRVVRELKLREDNAKLEAEIAASAGGSRFGNKFKSSAHEGKFGGRDE